jgi:oligopeptide transport system substrate-binding protein
MKALLVFLGVCMGLFTSCLKVDQPQNKKEQDLRINVRKEPVSLDPRKGNNMVASQMHFMLFEGLLRLTHDMTVVPAQAKSYEVSPDGKRYIFYLEDTKWSDGTTVTAYDFEKAWKSLLEPSFPCPDTYLLYPIKNAALAKEGKIPLSEVGICSKDAKTLIVDLESPSSHFLQVVASSVLLPVNSRLDAEDRNWATSSTNFISNGPFKLKEWKFNHEIILEKNIHYRLANKIKLNHVFIDVMDREMAALHMYTSGYFDLIGSPLSFFPSMLSQDLEKKELLSFFPVATTKFLAFNTAVFPFNNANIRRAFAFAINRKDIVDHITQLKEKEALNIIPPVLLPEKDSNYFVDNDVKRAKECFEKGLKELNIEVKDLGQLSFVYCSSSVNHSLAQELQNKWLKTLGVKVVLENVEFKILHERAQKGNFSIGLFAWLADYADPMNILERFQDKSNPRNYPKWQDENYNHLLEAALKESSREKYFEKIKDAERFLIEEMPITCLYHDNYAFLIHPHVLGFEVSPLGHIYFEKISIDSKNSSR